MKRSFEGLAMLLGLLLALVGCVSQSDGALPLAEDRPTLFFFYTDN